MLSLKVVAVGSLIRQLDEKRATLSATMRESKIIDQECPTPKTYKGRKQPGVICEVLGSSILIM